MQHKLLINGELVSGEGEKQPVYNPATGDVLLEIAEASAEQVDAAVRAADAAFAEWGQTTPKVRAECLLKLADVIEENGQVFAELESRNCGKPLHSAFNDEIPAIVDVFRFFAGAARCLNGLAAGEYLEGHTSMIRRDPLGVVASIAPWNYPLMMAAWKLAPALAAEGAKVGILDADIYGPSIPTMLGAENQRPTSPDGTHMAPIMSHGLATNSIGYLVTDDNAMVWRGPMASKALMQMLQETLWPDLDYLVLDMPPGTGDIQLTLAQNIPVTGAVVVTTPQDIALIDAKKGIVMFEKVEVPVLGIVENMSVHICSNCGHHEPIFGTGGAEKLAEKYHTQLLGQMPLHISLREDLDKGTPTVISRPESEFTAIYRQLADRVAAQLYWQGEVIPGEISFRAV